MMTDEELAEYYDTHSIMEDYLEAKKNGDVIRCKAGEKPLEAFRRHMDAKAQKTAAAIVTPRRRPVAATAVL